MMRTVFSSPNIVQHYVKFNLSTIVALEKLLGTRSFNIIMDHLVCCQIILPTSLRGIGLPLVVQFVALIFLVC
jgi:hypothetical protein